MDYSTIWVIFVFLLASMQSWFGKPIIVGWQGTSVWKRLWQSCTSTSIDQNSDNMLVDIFGHALPAPSPNRPLRNRDCTHPCWLLTSRGSQFQWITCLASRPPSMAMIAFLWSLISSQRWPLWLLARRPSQLRPPLSSCSSRCGFILGSHKQLFPTGIAISLVHSSPSYGHRWIWSSPNPLPSIPKLMPKWR